MALEIEFLLKVFLAPRFWTLQIFRFIFLRHNNIWHKNICSWLHEVFLSSCLWLFVFQSYEAQQPFLQWNLFMITWTVNGKRVSMLSYSRHGGTTLSEGTPHSMIFSSGKWHALSGETKVSMNTWNVSFSNVFLIHWCCDWCQGFHSLSNAGS